MDLIRALRVELLKLKRTKALWLTLVAPLFVVFLNFAMLFHGARTVETGGQLWDAHIISANLTMWFMIMNTLYVALMIAQLVGLEHTSQTLKYWFALPISRSTFYLAKLIVAIGLSFLAHFLLLGLAIASGFLADMLKPSLDFSLQYFHGSEYMKLLVFASLGSLLMLALHMWLSIRIKNMLIPIAIGFMGAVATLIATSSIFFQKFSPWMYPLDTIMASNTPLLQHFDYAAWPLEMLVGINVVGIIVVTLLAVLDLRRRDII